MSSSMDSGDTTSVDTVAEVITKQEDNSSDMEIKDVTIALEETSDLTETLRNGDERMESASDENASPEPIITEVSSTVSGKHTPEAEERSPSPDKDSVTNQTNSELVENAVDDNDLIQNVESLHNDDNINKINANCKDTTVDNNEDNAIISPEPSKNNQEISNNAKIVTCAATIENDNNSVTGDDDKHSEGEMENNAEETLHENGEVITPVDTVQEAAKVGSKDDANGDVADNSALIKERSDDLNCTNGAVENINDEDKEMITNLFKHFDSDETGAMSIAELGNFMRAMGMFPTDDEVEDLLTHMDLDKSGMVDLTELIKQMASQIQLRKEIDPEHDFKEAFLLFDKDGNGKISRDELVKVLTDHGTMKVTLEEAEDYIAMVDTDDDGMMNYSEFVTLFTQKIGI